MYLPRILVPAVFALLCGAAGAADAPPAVPQVPGVLPGNLPPALPGENTISNVQLKEGADGQWRLTYEYFYTGSPPLVMHYLQQRTTGGPWTGWAEGFPLKPVRRGRQVETVIVPAPQGRAGTITREVRIEVKDLQTHRIVASVQAPARIEWGDEATMNIDRTIAETSPEAVVERAAAFIDGGDRQMMIDAARPMLERVIVKHPRTHSAYVELARVAMKTNWNPDGLRRAETLIKSALEIAPDSVDAKILLGYVYAYQKRFKESEPLFAAAAKTGTNNLWLWVNWGELLQMQGRFDEALAKFRVVLDRPPTGDKNDRARFQAYAVALLMLEGPPRRVDAMEALLKRRVEDYGRNGCPGVSYARFLLTERADAAAATRLLQDQRQARCEDLSAQELLGLAHYVAWSVGMQADALRQARALLPAGPQLFHELASHERLVPVARKLLQAGERIDVQDKRGMDALGYALAAGHAGAAAQLLKLGSPIDSLQGPEKMPVALIPVLSADAEGIRLMQKAGVDYRTLRYRGATAFDHARQTGNETLLRALDPKSGKF